MIDTEIKESAPKIHLEGLNEIRALAALGVLLGHLHIGAESLAPDMVTVFFTLSGFLISFLLLVEKEKSKTINIRKFYVRRTLRIWPLYFFYIIVIMLLFGWTSNLWFYVFFAGNLAQFYQLIVPNLGHFWSLAVEEQFYLFWPWLSKYMKSFVVSMLGVLLVYWIFKIGAYLIYSGESKIYQLIYMSKFQSMAIGGIGAFIWYKKLSIISWITKPISELLVYGYFLLLLLGLHHTVSFVDPEILSVVVVVFILQQVSNQVFVRLRSKILSFVGMISFGVYVYHPLIIYGVKQIPFLESNYYAFLISVVMITIFVSYISYQFLENPFLKFKDRFVVIKSTSKA